MKQIQTRVSLLLAGVFLLTVGGGLGWWLARQQTQMHVDDSGLPTASSADTENRKILYWYDPMAPQQHFDKPGKSPYMDMDLVPKYADSSASSNQEQPSGVSIDSMVADNIGIRLATVARMPLRREIEVSGLMGFNERDIAIVQTRSAGFVERVWPLAAGDVVKSGQPLAEILVPEWAAAQQELLAVRNLADESLLKASRDRLHLLGMPSHLIRQLEASGRVQSNYTLRAPIAGVIQTLDVRAGMTLTSGQTLAKINGLAVVWLEIAVPESQADLARKGNRAEVRLSGMAGYELEAKIAEVLPSLTETSRTIRVRIELDNPEQQLRPGQSAQVRLSSLRDVTALTIPTEALIRTGKRTLVMLAGEQGRFFPVEVTAGSEIGDQTQIIAGLEAGQQVVASGQFLIDSEASLNGIEARLLPRAPHQHMMEGAQ